MRSLVTGNKGFIGKHLVHELTTKRLNEVYGFDMLKDYPTVDSISEFLKNNKIEHVYHLGARAFIPDCFSNAIELVNESNVNFTIKLLMACKQSETVKRFLYMSTSEVYGNAPKFPINERTPVNPQSTYAVSKYSAESYARSFAAETDLDVRILRQFNVYGPGDTHARIIPKIMSAAKHKTKLSLGPLNVTRDFSYVTDVARVITNVMNIPDYHLPADKILVNGLGRETSIGELIKTIEKIYGTKIEYVSEPKNFRPRDVFRLVSETTNYDRIFGKEYFGCERIGIVEGIQRTKEWYDKNDWEWEKHA